jgi:hypothetical protein
MSNVLCSILASAKIPDACRCVLRRFTYVIADPVALLQANPLRAVVSNYRARYYPCRETLLLTDERCNKRVYAAYPIMIKAVPLSPLGAKGKGVYSSYTFLTSALDGVSGQRHAPAALFPQDRRRLVGPQSWSGHRGF